jgi:nucleoside phosphorylase
MTNIASQNHRADVLIVTVTKVEAQAVMAAFKISTSAASVAISLDDRTYRDLGMIAGSRVFMAMSEMGTGGVGGSQETIRKAIATLLPSAVIMVGIAFGVDKKKQAIGDILVSNQILPYELQRVGESTNHSRADKAHASPHLISWLRQAELDWEDANGKVRFGLVLSGEKLIDNITFKDTLVRDAGEAIGGEMEGAGLYSVCSNEKKDWILVKAICDWADGNKGKNKDKNQKKAAENAAAFVLHALQTIPLKRVTSPTNADCQVEFLIGRLDESTEKSERVVTELKAVGSEAHDNTAAIVDRLVQAEAKLQFASTSLPFHAGLVDDEIQKELRILRCARFFDEFSRTESAITLGDKVESGNFAGGSNGARSCALAWCARVLGSGGDQARSDRFLITAKSLGNSEEVVIATAFAIAAKGVVDDAMGMLAKLSSAIARSAAFFIQRVHGDAETAIKWLADAGLTQDDLDPDGKSLYLKLLLECKRWDDAFACTSKIAESDFQAAPALLWCSAMAFLVRTTAEEYRASVLQCIPFDAVEFPLASDGKSLVLRRKAGELFVRCANIVRDFSCADTASLLEDYALWLRLRDSSQHSIAIEDLRASMHDPVHVVRRVPLAVQFGLALDVDAVGRQINQETALTGGTSPTAALARFALVFRMTDHNAMAEYIDRYRSQLYQHLAKAGIQAIEVEALARAGLQQLAESKLNEMIADGLTGGLLQRLQAIVNSVSGQDQTQQLKAAFAISNDLKDLDLLVALLRENNDWQQLSIFTATLFARTRSISDAELLALALRHTRHFRDLGVLLRQIPELLDQSDQLQAHWCETLYREGALTSASTELKKLQAKRDHPGDRHFAAELAVTSGDWEDLLRIVEEEWTHREHRSAEELIRAANAAQLEGSRRTKDLMRAAAEKGSNDPQILFGAYSVATHANLEDGTTVSTWLQAAAKLSDEDGPMRKMSLRDLLDMKPDWDRLLRETMEKVVEGVFPLCGAANLLNESLVSMMLAPTLANSNESDPRRRRIIPCYSGGRQTGILSGNVIAIEATVLLTLAHLGMLNQLEGAFQQVIVPHATLRWLYNEKQKARYHQPSQISKAQEIKRLLANGILMPFNATVPHDVDLASDIGDDLAAFIAEARIIDNGGNGVNKKFIIVSPPIYRVTSLMEEEADVSAYSAHLCSCMAILAKLEEKGQLTVAEAERASTYLRMHEKDWPNQPVLSDSAVLYLDNTSVSYLHHTKLLGKLKSAGLKAYISKSEIDQADAFINYEAHSSIVLEIIEEIRIFLVKGMSAGQILLAPMPVDEFANETGGESNRSDIGYHPTMTVFYPGRDVDSIIVDDRALNRNLFLDMGDGKNIPISTTLDLLNTFVAREIISITQLFEAKTRLRRTGYVFIPLTVEELQSHLTNAKVKEEALFENAELRAIRENLLQIRMSNFLQFPQEVLWFHQMMKTFIETLKAQWFPKMNEAVARARSKWLLGFLDSRGWAHAMKGGNGLGMVEIGFGSNVSILVMAALGMTKVVRDAYSDWLESALLMPLRNESPDLWLKIMEQLKEHISNLSTADDLMENNNE